MDMSITYVGIPDENLRRRSEPAWRERLARALDRFENRIQDVKLYVHDVNGPRGGEDMECRCVLHLKKMPPIVIQDRDASIHRLMYRVVNRLVHALTQKLDRKTKRSRVRNKLVRDSETRSLATDA
jgi:putative sigma-54 modulation protein